MLPSFQWVNALQSGSNLASHLKVNDSSLDAKINSLRAFLFTKNSFSLEYSKKIWILREYSLAYADHNYYLEIQLKKII